VSINLGLYFRLLGNNQMPACKQAIRLIALLLELLDTGLIASAWPTSPFLNPLWLELASDIANGIKPMVVDF
jgi:hypothetical protein